MTQKDRPARILFVVPRFHTNLAGAVKALASVGHTVAVFAPISYGSEDHSVLTPTVLGETPEVSDVERAFAAFAPDIVFVRKALPLTKIALPIAQRSRAKVFTYSLKPVDEVMSLRAQIKNALKGQPKYRVSPVPGQSLSSAPAKNAFFLPWPYEPGPPTKIRGSGPLRILCVAKLRHRRKNHKRLIAALDALPRDAPWALTLAGSSAVVESIPSDAPLLDELEKHAAESPTHRPITFDKDRPFAEMPSLYAEHDVLVLPADTEPLGMTVLEGMAHGLAVVVSEQSGAAGYVTDGQDGLRVDMDDPDALGLALNRLFEDRGFVQNLGEAARKTAQSVLTPRAFLEAFDRLPL